MPTVHSTKKQRVHAVHKCQKNWGTCERHCYLIRPQHYKAIVQIQQRSWYPVAHQVPLPTSASVGDAVGIRPRLQTQLDAIESRIIRQLLLVLPSQPAPPWQQIKWRPQLTLSWAPHPGKWLRSVLKLKVMLDTVIGFTRLKYRFIILNCSCQA